jgi:Gpi18-like mannosyltransferase
LGIALRVLLLFNVPNLSDDYARFVWDGRLTAAGYHPFLYLPSYFIENQIFPQGVTPELYARLNSPNYYTVYPPVCQALYAIAAWVSPSSIWGAVFSMKLFLLAAEIGVLFLLKKVCFGALRPGLLYALNPLAIIELTGNCHFEGMMAFFLLAGLWAFQRNNTRQAAGFWALATATKMLPLIFLPIAWRWLGLRKGLVFCLFFGLFSLLLFAPLLAVLPNIAQSLDLYFREFQFNASIYYLVRQVGYWVIGWDVGNFSGPWLAAISSLAILVIALLVKSRPVPDVQHLAIAMLFALFAYLSLAAVVQPWYLILPLVISLLTHWRFVLWWSGLVALSYSHYENGLRAEHFPLIGLEYGLLWAGLLWETWQLLRGKIAGTPEL